MRMNKLKVGNPTPTSTLISRLRLMAGAGGMLSRDRLITISEAADRLDEYEHGLYKEECDTHEEHINCNECFYCDKEDRWCLRLDLVNMHDGFYCSYAKRKEGDEA